MVEFVPVMPNNFLRHLTPQFLNSHSRRRKRRKTPSKERNTDVKIVLGVIEGEVERHVGVVDVDINELDDVLVRNLPQQLQEKRNERKPKLKVKLK